MINLVAATGAGRTPSPSDHTLAGICGQCGAETRPLFGRQMCARCGVLEYAPTPTLARFHADTTSFYRGVMGPFRSGKSTACVMEILTRACMQAPYRGVRRSRWLVIRNTYPELRSTTIPTWTAWVSEQVCPITYSPLITGRMTGVPASFDGQPDGTTVDLEVYFLALDRPRDIGKLLGTEFTGAWVNEARELPKANIDALSRVGSYPYLRDGGASWSGVIMDTNPPDNDHWWYTLAEQECPDGWAFYRQPGGLRRNAKGKYVPNPEAENIAHLTGGYNYYLRQVPGKDAQWINVYVMGEYGAVYDGRPVYEHVYLDSVHASQIPLPIYRGLPLYLGWDFGLTPACVIAQLTSRGRLNVLREYCCERGGIRQFARDTVLPALANEFAGMQVISTGDPAGANKSELDKELSCIGELMAMGIPTLPAATNDFVVRREAVLRFLTASPDGGPGLLLDPSCQVLRRGFQGAYQFDRVQVGGDERYRDQPRKNQYSHPHDALQYLCMRAGAPVRGEQRGRSAPAPRNTMRALT